MRQRIGRGLWALCLAVCAQVNADDALRQCSVFVEAEDFEPKSQTWWAGTRWADDIYSPTSGDAVLANNGGGKEVVSREVVLPQDGAYHVWVRYLKIGEYPGSFGLRITQNDRIVFDEKYRTQPKGKSWDPIWEKFPATLKAGPATLTLYIAQPGIRQRIDCILLTTNLEYGTKKPPDFRDFGPQVFFRYRFLEPALPTTVHVQSYIRRGPVYYHDLGVATRSGIGTGGGEIPAGEWSPWFEITKITDSDQFIATVHLHFRSAGKPVEAVKADFQVAPEPTEEAAKTLHEDLDGDIVTLLIPGNLRKFSHLLELASQNTRRHLETARAFGFTPLPAGQPQGIMLETYICGFRGMFNSRRMLAEEMEVARLLGMNAFPDLIGVARSVAAQQGVLRTFLNAWLPYQVFACPTKSENARLIEDAYRAAAERITKEDPEALRIAYRTKLYDEPGTGSLDHIAQCESCTRTFREYLRQHNVTPAELGKESWDQVGVIKRDAATDTPSRRLYYWAIQFRDYSMAQVFKLGTEMTEKYLGKHILAGVNFTNAGLSDWAGGLIDGPDWFMIGRERAQSIMWSEDWTSLGPDGTGYVVDVLRSAGTPHNLPVGMYIIANDPIVLPLKTYSALIHGAKVLNFYCYGPHYAFGDGSLSENVPAQKALAAVTREIAKADDLLYPGRVSAAQVAISFFKSHELWQHDIAIQVERRNTYLALTHANYPVDFLDEAMVEEGKLNRYKVFYLVDSNLSQVAAERIKNWVERGGVLVTCAGAGLRDQFDGELNTLRSIYGISEVALTKPRIGYRERYDLPHIQPTQTASFSVSSAFAKSSAPVIGYQEALIPSSATVVATFDDGKPAALINQWGKGTVIHFAFLPGLAYAKDARRAEGKVVVGYLDSERQLITAGARLARVIRPVECSAPLIEASLLSSSRGSVVPLANWSMEPIRSLTVILRPPKQVKAVESVKQGKLRFKTVPGGIQVTLPLESTDMLLVR